jgi:hypothetical protein
MAHPTEILLVALQTTHRWNRKSQRLISTPNVPPATFLRDVTPHIGRGPARINSSLVLRTAMHAALPTHLQNVAIWHRDFNLYWDSRQWKAYMSPSGLLDETTRIYVTTQTCTWTWSSGHANVTRRTHLAAVRCTVQAWWYGLGHHSLDLSTSTPVNTIQTGEVNEQRYKSVI